MLLKFEADRFVTGKVNGNKTQKNSLTSKAGL